METMRIKLITILLIVLVILPVVPLAAIEKTARDEMIRIAIIKSAESVTIDGDGLLAISDGGVPISLKWPQLVRASRSQIILGGESYKRLRVTSALGSIKVNRKGYSGVVELSVSNGGLLIVNELPLEKYLVGLINSEISSTWPMESIKTQAVIARTYAVAKRDERKRAYYHLESTVMDQAYDGSDMEDSRAARGVNETSGQVLTWDGKVIQAFYHATCGGRTEASENVWGFALPYLKGVDCEYCANGNSNRWEIALPLTKIAAALKLPGVADIKAGVRNGRGRLKDLIIGASKGTVVMPATKFRMSVGSTVVKSTNFTLRLDDGVAYLNGTGYGHGVGLCQWGARQRALDGFTYSEILSYYYPGTEIRDIKDIR